MEPNRTEPQTIAFEQGPIRPPNEAASLLVRVTRNCPWNRCAFCPVYKGTRFSLRDPEEVKGDIRAMARLAVLIGALLEKSHGAVDAELRGLLASDPSGCAVQVARFVLDGARTAFLQDANSLIMRADDLVGVLECLRDAFPSVERVTSYARSHTLRKRSVEELTRLREAGLDRIHIGLESGSDAVLELIDKGITGERHIEAGLRVKEAGMELSEYIMPGLGGVAHSEEHATETARVLRAIDPHFIRLRSLAISPRTPLAEMCERGEFEPLDDVGTARELRTLLAGFEGMTGTVRSDHILNLLEEIEGTLPEDLPAMRAAVDRFLALDEEERDTFIVGRRIGLFRRLDDLDHTVARTQAERARDEIRRAYPGPLSRAIREIMTRFV